MRHIFTSYYINYTYSVCFVNVSNRIGVILFFYSLGRRFRPLAVSSTTDELSSLLDAAAEANDDQKVAAYDAACANILEHAYQLPLVYQQTTITTNAALKGVEANPMGVYMLRDFYFE